MPTVNRFTRTKKGNKREHLSARREVQRIMLSVGDYFAAFGSHGSSIPIASSAK